MFSSHAPAWEAIACVNVKKAKAVADCLKKVKEVARPKPSNDKLAREDVLSRAMTAIKIHGWIELARSWTKVGNDPKALSGAVTSTSREVVLVGLQDPLIRELVADNLRDIGVSVERVEQGFEKAYDNLLSEFPGTAAPSLTAMALPSTSPRPPASTSNQPGDRDGCLKTINVKVAACMDVEFKRPGRSSSDFSYIAGCQSKFAAETASCPR
jgi:hypothetical protein